MTALVAKFGRKLTDSGFWRDAAAALAGQAAAVRFVLCKDDAEVFAHTVANPSPQPNPAADWQGRFEFPVDDHVTCALLTPQPLPPTPALSLMAAALRQMWQDVHIQRGLSQETLKRYREESLLLKAAIAFNGMLEPQAIAAHLLSYFHRASGAAILTPEGAVVAGTGCLAHATRLVLPLGGRRAHLQNEGERFGWRAYLWYPLETETPLDLLIVSTRDSLTFDTVDLQKVSLLAQLGRAALNVAAEAQARQTLSRYMAPPIVEKLLRENAAALGGTEQEATILFADIRNFTALTAAQGARETVAFLNSYFGCMVEVVQAHRGIVDKFLGDGLLAVFGVPFAFADAADQAVRAAEAMLAAIARRAWPAPLRIGIGISSGVVIAGNVGSAERMDYTVIGDPVNQAAKLQDISKKTGAPIVLTEATYARLTPDLQRRCRGLELTLNGVGVFGVAEK